MQRNSDPPFIDTIAYVPRPRRRSTWTAVGILTLLVIAVIVAGPIAAVLLRLAAILLTVALVAGAVALAALRIGIAPHLRSRPLG